MPIPLTVVICCAGRGSRLGLGTTKALTEIHGQPLIAWQLALLSAEQDVRIVVGYEARQLIDVVTKIRRDVTFVFNHEYQTTHTAASLALACVGAPADGHILSLDGDLLVHPRDLRRVLAEEKPCLGITPAVSADPVYAILDGMRGHIIGFTRESTHPKCPEWSGLFRLDVSAIRASIAAGEHRGHVFQMLDRHLPLPAVEIDAAEIDTPEDFYRAEAWLACRVQEWGGHV